MKLDAGERADARLARVRAVVAAGRRVADPDDPIGVEARRAILATSGLSREGVELALTRHLETDPEARDLELLIARASTAEACHVVLSAHVCVGALRAMAVAVATAPRVAVRPSRRDPTLARLLVEILARDPSFASADGVVRLVAEVTSRAGDELHVYGSDESVRALRGEAGDHVVVRGHGTGLGVAIVGPEVDLERAARAVAEDVVPFDQQGCLSPRFALVAGDPGRAARFGRALDAALSELSARVPRGSIDAATRAEIARYRSAMDAIGDVVAGADHVIGVDPAPRALLLPPAARVVHVAPFAPPLLETWSRFITVIGGDEADDDVRAALALAPGARRAALGAMQRPPLDGPVDLRLERR